MSTAEKAKYKMEGVLLDDDEVKFLCFVINTLGCGQHAIADESSLSYFKLPYIQELLERALSAVQINDEGREKALDLREKFGGYVPEREFESAKRGNFRLVIRYDLWYVVTENFCWPVESENMGHCLLQYLDDEDYKSSGKADCDPVPGLDGSPDLPRNPEMIQKIMNYVRWLEDTLDVTLHDVKELTDCTFMPGGDKWELEGDPAEIGYIIERLQARVMSMDYLMGWAKYYLDPKEKG